MDTTVAGKLCRILWGQVWSATKNTSSCGIPPPQIILYCDVLKETKFWTRMKMEFSPDKGMLSIQNLHHTHDFHRKFTKNSWFSQKIYNRLMIFTKYLQFTHDFHRKFTKNSWFSQNIYNTLMIFTENLQQHSCIMHICYPIYSWCYEYLFSPLADSYAV